MKSYFRFLIPALVLISCMQNQPPQSRSMKKESDEDRTLAFKKYPDALYPVRVKNKWGYMDRNASIVIEPSFDAAEDFNGELAVAGVVVNDQLAYGYIDRQGEWKIKPVYQRAKQFSESKAVVQKDDMYGYIDINGNEVIPCQFENAGSFSEGIAAVKKNGWTGFIDTTGMIIIEPKFTCSVDHPVFSKGMAPVFGADEKTGFINPSGEWVIEPKFHSAGKFTGDVAWAMIMEDDASAQHGFNIKGGYIDRRGEFVIGPEYDFGWDFHEGYATVWEIGNDRTQKLWSVIDSTGQKILSDLAWRNMGSYNKGLIPFQHDDMKWGFMNIKGEEVIAPVFTGMNHFQNGLARMELGSAFSPTFIYINERGESVWKE